MDAITVSILTILQLCLCLTTTHAFGSKGRRFRRCERKLVTTYHRQRLEQTGTSSTRNVAVQVRRKEQNGGGRGERNIIVPTENVSQFESNKSSDNGSPSTLPAVPDLDQSTGMLPPAAYMSDDDTCRIQVSWDMDDVNPRHTEIDSDDISVMVRTMQHSIDGGMTSFAATCCNQEWTQDTLFHAFIADTPMSVVRRCQLLVPLHLEEVMGDPSIPGSRVTSNSVRHSITSILRRLGTDRLDRVEIQFPKLAGTDDEKEKCSYYLDLLDKLRDVQEEGLVHCISSASLPSEPFTSMAASVGLDSVLRYNRVDSNLFNPKYGPKETATTSNRCSTIISNPLAGGWLTDNKLVDQQRLSTTMRKQWLSGLTNKERQNWKNISKSNWFERQDCGNNKKQLNHEWSIYNNKMLLPLQEIARRYGVSIASIVLRWTLQQQFYCSSSSINNQEFMNAGVVVSRSIIPERYQRRKCAPASNDSRVKQLREVFTFELSNKDMEVIWNLSGWTSPNEESLSDEEALMHEQEWLQENKPVRETPSGILIPGSAALFDANDLKF